MDVELINIICGSCGVPHAIPKVLYDTMKRESGHWTCPNGHSRGWTKGSLEEDLETCKQNLQYSKNRADDLARRNEGLIKQIAIQKGLVTKAKNKLKIK